MLNKVKSCITYLKHYINYQIFKIKLNFCETIEEYIDLSVRYGFIHKSGMPLKCSCGCTKLFLKIEYDLNCDNCDKKVGHWAYGSWIK